MIRLATLDDLPDIMTLLVAFHGENGRGALDAEKVVAEVSRLLDDGTIWVVEGPERLVGLIGIVRSEPWYSTQSEFHDRFVFVEPEYRAAHLGAALLSAAKAEALRREIPLIVTVTNPKRANARGRIATLEGFSPIGEKLRIV